ncbi:MAG: 30S ribosomal protein S13 [Desulfurococcaceae archaeon]
MSRAFRPIVRIAGTDVEGRLRLVHGLAEIKGVGYNLALSICRTLGLDPDMKTGFLTENEIKEIEKVLRNPVASGIPPWAVNRRKDPVTGEDVHFVEADLIFHVKEDIEREKRIKSWRGIRHALGLKVRGQRTRTTGRTGITVGVRKRRAEQQQQKK